MIDRFKIFPAFVTAVFFLTNVLWAYSPEKSFWDERRANTVRSQMASLSALTPSVEPIDMSKIPALTSGSGAFQAKTSADLRLQHLSTRHGTIKDVHLSPDKSAPLILLVQDVHLNDEAQRNIAAFLEELESRNSTAGLLVGVEGAFGRFDFAPFRAFSAGGVIEQIADFLFIHKKISAPSYVGLRAAKPTIKVTGIDDKAHYSANVEAYVESWALKPVLTARLKELLKESERNKNEILNPIAKEFDTLQQAYRQNKLGLGPYLVHLQKIEERNNHEVERELVLQQFLIAYDIEKSLDFGRVERERTEVLRELMPRLGQEEVRELWAFSVALKTGELSFSEYYKGLRSLFERHRISLSRTPEFNRYVEYVLLSGGIQAEKLWAAVERYEEMLATAVAPLEKESAQLKQARFIDLLFKLANFSLTPGEWSAFCAMEKAHPEWGRGLPIDTFKAFYEHADARSHKMVDRILQEIPPSYPSSLPIVLIAGGFHTPLLADIIRRNKSSYAVLQPKITKVEEGTGVEYLSIFTQEKTPIEKLFAGEKLFLAPDKLALGDGTENPSSRGVEFAAILMGVVGYLKAHFPLPQMPGFKVIASNGLYSVSWSGQTIRFALDKVSRAVENSPFGPIYLYPPVREMFLLPLIFAGLDTVLPGTALLRLFFALINAIVFTVLFHDNTKDGKLQWSAVLARTVGAFAIVGGAWGIIGYWGGVDGGESLVWMFLNQGWSGRAAGIGFLALTVLFHAVWNKSVKAQWRLSIGSFEEEDESGGGVDEEDEEGDLLFDNIVAEEMAQVAERHDQRLALRQAMQAGKARSLYQRAKAVAVQELKRYRESDLNRRFIELLSKRQLTRAELKELLTLIQTIRAHPGNAVVFRDNERLSLSFKRLEETLIFFIGYLENSAKRKTGRLEAPSPLSSRVEAPKPARTVSIEQPEISRTEYIPPEKLTAETRAALVQARAPPRIIWGHVLLVVISFAVLFYALPIYHGLISAMVPVVSAEGVGFSLLSVNVSFLGTLAWLLKFTADVSVILSSVVVAGRVSLGTAWGREVAEYLASGKKVAERSFAGQVFVGLMRTMYSFGFEGADRLFQIYQQSRVVKGAAEGPHDGGDRGLESNEGVVGGKADSPEERIFRYLGAVPALQITLLPFFATASYLRSRLKIMIYSSLLGFGVNSILAGGAYVYGGTAASTAFMSWYLKLNLLDPAGTGWMAGWINTAGIKSALAAVTNVSAIINALGLSHLLVLGGHATAATKAKMESRKTKSYWINILLAIPIWFVQLWLAFLRNMISPTFFWGNLRQAAKNAFSLHGGLHWVNLEIQVLLSVSAFSDILHGFVMKIEGDEGVLGSGQMFANHLLGPFGLGPETATVPFTGGKNTLDLYDYSVEDRIRQVEQEQAMKIRSLGLKPDELGVPMDEFHLPPAPGAELIEPEDVQSHRGLERSSEWIAEKALMSKARWELWQAEARLKAKEFAEKTGRPVALPELAVNEMGIPIEVAVVQGRVNLLYTDGSRQPINEAQFDPLTRSFAPLAGKSFKLLTLDLDPGKSLRSFNQRPVLDLSGRPVPPSGFWPVENDTIIRELMLWRDLKGHLHASRPDTEFSLPVDPKTGFEIVFGGNETHAGIASEKAQRDLAALKNRRAVLAELRDNPGGHAALIIDPDTNAVKERIESLDDLRNGRAAHSRLEFWAIDPLGRRVPFEADEAGKRADIVTVKDKQGEEALVLFPLKGPSEELAARADAQAVMEELLGAISTGAHPRAAFDPPPIYMIAEKNNGQTVLLNGIKPAVNFMDRLGMGKTIDYVAGGNPLYQDFVLKNKEWRLITNDSPSFQDKMMDIYTQTQQRGGFGVRLSYDPQTKELLGLSEVRVTPREQRALQEELRERRLNGENAAPVVVGDRYRVHSFTPGEWRQVNARQPAVQTRDGNVLVRLAFRDGEEYQLLSPADFAAISQSLYSAQGNDYIVKFSLAYKVKEGEVIQSIDQPKELRTLLERDDLVFTLSNGLNVPAGKLPAGFEAQGLKVIGIYDPVDGATIKLGTEWRRLNYLIDEAVRREHLSREKSHRYKSAVPEVVVDGRVVPYNPLYEWELMNYLENLRLDAEREIDPTARQNKFQMYLQAAEERAYFRPDSYDRWDKVVIKGTLMQRIWQGWKEREELVQARKMELLKVSGKGGELVIPYGAERVRARVIESELNELAKAWRSTDAQIEAIRRDRSNAPAGRLVALIQERDALENSVQTLLDEIARIELQVQRKEAARRARGGSEMGPGTDVTIKIFGPRFSVEDALDGQRKYLQTLREREKSDEAGPRQKRAAARELAMALEKNSYMDWEGNEHVIVPSVKQAEWRAADEERTAQLDRQFLELEDKLAGGEKVLIRWEFKKEGEKIVMRTSYEDPDRYLKQVRDRIRTLPDGPRKENYQRALNQLTQEKFLSMFNAEGVGVQLALMDDSFAKGGALETIIDLEKSGAAGISIRPVPLADAQKVKAAKLAEWKKELAGLPEPGIQRPLIQKIRNAENGVLVYSEDLPTPRIHKWQFYSSEASAAATAEKLKEQVQTAVAEAQLERNGIRVIEIDPIQKETRLIVDAREVRQKIEKLNFIRNQMLLLQQGVRPPNDQQQRQIGESLRNADRGIFEEDGKTFIVKYGVEQGRENYARLLEKFSRSRMEEGRIGEQYTLFDQHQNAVGTVKTNGLVFLTTVGTVLETNEKDLSLIKLETFAGRAPPTPEQKGRLIGTTWDFVNDRRQIVARGIGHVGGKEPLFIIINDFGGPLAGVDRPAQSQTYRVQKGLALSEYPNHPELKLDSSKALMRLDDGSIVIEKWMANGKVSRDILGIGGRVEKTVEGIYRAGIKLGQDPFEPQRVIIHQYDDVNYAMLDVPSSSIFTDADTGRVLGWSRVTTRFDEYLKNRTIQYERWDDTTKEMVWEVKNVDGRLTLKYALKKIGDRHVPTNVTVFYYSYAGQDSYGQLGLADEAYTFVTDANGLIEGKIDPSQYRGNFRELNYFEFTKIVKVDLRGPDTRVIYRISVRDERDNVALQYQEVKNPNGDLLEKYVITESAPDQVRPSDVTVNTFDSGPNSYGKLKIPKESKTFSVSVGRGTVGRLFDLGDLELAPGSTVVGFDETGRESNQLRVLENGQFADGRGLTYPKSYLAAFPKADDISRFVIQDDKGDILFTFTLKERSTIEGILPDGRLTYIRNLFKMWGEDDGRFALVVQSVFRDTVLWGETIRSHNLTTDRDSAVAYDAKKWMIRGRTIDNAEHPSWVNRDGKGEVLEDVSRELAGKMKNPFLPDAPPQLLVAQKVIYREPNGAPLYEGRQMINFAGRTVVEVREKAEHYGIAQAVTIHLDETEPLQSDIVSLIPGENKLTSKFAGGEEAADLKSADFVYFYLEEKDVHFMGEFNVRATFRENAGQKIGKAVTVSSNADDPDAQLQFWLAVPGNELKFKNILGDHVASLQLVAESAYANKTFVYAVPVAALAEHLDVSRMAPSVELTVQNKTNSTSLAGVSAVYRIGRGEAQIGRAQLEDRDDSFHMPVGKGVYAFYDATKTSKEGRAVEFRAADNRLLAVYKEHWVPSESSGINVVDKKVVLYDKTGMFSIAEIPVEKFANGIYFDVSGPAQILPHSNFDRGDKIEVVSKHPIFQENLVRSLYSKKSINPSRAVQIFEGDFSDLPQLKNASLHEVAYHRLLNALPSWLWRNPGAFEGEDVLNSDAALGVVNPELNEAIRESLAALNPEGANLTALSRVVDRLEKIPRAIKVADAVVAQVEVPELAWWKILSFSGLVLLGLIFYPLLIHFKALYTSGKVKKYRAAAAAIQEKIRFRGFTYYTPIEQRYALRRHAKEVLRATAHQSAIDPYDGKPLYISSNGDIEGPLLQTMITLYVQAFSGILRQYQAAERELNVRAGLSDHDRQVKKAQARALRDNRLRRLDYFTRGVYKFLAVELARGNTDPGKSRYRESGAFRPQIVSELTLLLSVYREKMALGMINDHLRDGGQDPLIVDNPEYRDLSFESAFNGMLVDLVQHRVVNNKPIALMDDRHENDGPKWAPFQNDKFRFNEERLISFLELRQVASVHPIFQFYGRYLFKLFPVFWGIILLRGGEVLVTGIPALGPILGLIAFGLIVTVVVNVATERRAILNASRMRPNYEKPFLSLGPRVIAPIISASGIGYLMMFGVLNLAATVISTLLLTVLLFEIAGLVLGGNRSSLGVAAAYHLNFSAYVDGKRGVWMTTTVQGAFSLTAISIGTFVVQNWFFEMFAGGAVGHVMAGGAAFIILLCALHLGVYWLVMAVGSALFPVKTPEVGPDALPAKPKGDDDDEASKMAHIYLGNQTVCSPIFNLERGPAEILGASKEELEQAMGKSVEKFVGTLMNRFENWETREAAMTILRAIAEDVRLDPGLRGDIVKWIERGDEKNLVNLFKTWLLELRRAEWRAKVTLWDLAQLNDPNMLRELQVGRGLSDDEKVRIEHAFQIQQVLVQTGGFNLTGSSMDVPAAFLRLAVTARERGLAEKIMFIMVGNIWNEYLDVPLPDQQDFSETTEIGQRIKFAMLLKYMSRMPGQKSGGAEAYVLHVITVQANKASMFNSLFLIPEVFRRIGQFMVFDQNTSLFDMDSHWRDQMRMWAIPHLMGLIPNRITTSRDQAVTETDFTAEGGFIQKIRSYVTLVFTGWGGTQKNRVFAVLRAMGDPSHNIMTFNPDFLAAVTGGSGNALINRMTGLKGYALTSGLISEDTAGIIGLMHDEISLSGSGGGESSNENPMLAIQEARDYRARASAGNIEEHSKDKPRWVAGYFQMGNDLLTQQGFEFSSHPYSVREMRAMEADIWTLLPIVFLLAFLSPYLTIFGALPFIGKVIYLFVQGMVFNQMATVFSLLNNIRYMGFAPGLAKYLGGRNVDFDIWPFRVVREMLAVITGWMSPPTKFDLSGGKTNSDPASVIWSQLKAALKDFRNSIKSPHNFGFTAILGMFLFASNFASIWWLDASSVFMMLLLLRFSAGAAFGVFVASRTRGHVIGRYGWWDALFKGVGASLGAAAMLGASFIFVQTAAVGLGHLASSMLGVVLIMVWVQTNAKKLMNWMHSKEFVKSERMVSLVGRAFWDFLMWFGWFVFVPLAPRFKFSLLPWSDPLIFTPTQFLAIFLILIGSVGLIILFGKTMGIKDSKRINLRFVYFYRHLLDLQAQLRENPNDVELTSLVALVHGALIETHINANAGSWKVAGERLDYLEDLLIRHQIIKEKPVIKGRELVAVSGAMGFWAALGERDERIIGWWEGIFTGLSGLWLFSTLLAQGPPFGSMYVAAALTGLILTAALFSGHWVTGVLVPNRARPVFEARVTHAATLKSMTGLISLPFIVWGVFLPNVFAAAALIAGGILLGGYLHRSVNAVEDPFARPVREIIQMKRRGASEQFLENEILPVVPVGLTRLGHRGEVSPKPWLGKDDSPRLAKTLVRSETGFSDLMKVLDLASSDGSVELYENLAEWEELLGETDDNRSSDVVIFVAQGRNLKEVSDGIRQSILRRNFLGADGRTRERVVVLNAAQEGMKDELVQQGDFANLQFLTESDLAQAEDAGRLLAERFLMKGDMRRRMKVVVPAGAVLPAAFVEGLETLSRLNQFKELIRIVLLESVDAEGWVAEGGVSLLNQILKFRELVGAQA